MIMYVCQLQINPLVPIHSRLPPENVVHLTPLAFDLPSLEMLDLEKTAQTLLLETLPPL